MISTGLAERLRHETRGRHVAAERAPAMAALLRGRMSRTAYRDLLVDLAALYGALEDELHRHADAPAIAPLCAARLARAPALASDLAQLARDLGSPASPPGAIVLRQIERLHELGRSEPHRLVAHAYVRYLGDLSGGQILTGIVADKIRAPVAFYDFGGRDAARRLAAEFRDALDRLPLDSAAIDAVVDEACSAFDWHIALFDRAE